jgi:CDP-glucose 4,6-dehydratase
MIDSYRNSFFNIKKINQHQKGIAVARAGNVIGGGDWSKDRLIPDIVKALMANEPIIIRNPASVRPWQHVLEPMVGYLSLGIHLQQKPIQFSQAFNFGPKVEDSMSVEDMVKIAIQSWGYGEYKIEKEANHPKEARLLRLDISKVKAEMNWVPKMDAQIAVSMTMDWYNIFFSNPIAVNEKTAKNIIDFLS